MTDATHETIADLAHRLLSTEDVAKPAETHRLASFIVDHSEHLTFASQPPTVATKDGYGSGGAVPALSQSELQRRLASNAPAQDHAE